MWGARARETAAPSLRRLISASGRCPPRARPKQAAARESASDAGMPATHGTPFITGGCWTGGTELSNPDEGDEKFVEDEQVALLFDEGQDGINIDEWKKNMATDKELQKILTYNVMCRVLNGNFGSGDSWDETFLGVRGLKRYFIKELNT
ncbi:hypothetical protein NDU88_003182 [Pleurodeles waltl]|uniref:Uncharacterized protein n=1 Tax=Pleurodeles waltl TaxID=8319 RepID=A0AAV7WUL3_PLEWA|nr:hypothetical protein NDU88_003182 [Pleurodeles waltl]